MFETEIEAEFHKRISNGTIRTKNHFLHDLMQLYRTILGEHGYIPFRLHVVPQLEQKFGQDYLAAGKAALHIIQQAGTKQPENIDEYIKNAAIKTAPERINIPKNQRPKERKKPTKEQPQIAQIERTIERIIRNEEEKRTEGSFYNVCGVLLSGNYVRRRETKSSTLDITALTVRSIDWHCKDFIEQIKETLRVPVVYLGNVRWDSNEVAERVYIGVINGNYRIVSPHGPVKTDVEKILKNYRKCTTQEKKKN